MILGEKKVAWRKFCTNYYEKFGRTFKAAFNKFQKSVNIMVNNSGNSFESSAEKIEYRTEYFFPQNSSSFRFHRNITPEKIHSLTHSGLQLVFHSLKIGKATGPEWLDYRT
ncbi:hypothetical protein AVEN_152149-1 [Araneus ventricosus]|uniref:Uncharacterized protein n=1 Tax=Araneus ventricosus TaxID=182803 RepID=A0A4Y2HL11_ARAVE|nr:hypothetical protein AVEN_152149-1 [Araneus ventricosus]